MKTVFCIIVLIVAAAVAKFLSLFVLNIAGLPGSLLAVLAKRNKALFACGVLVNALGQSYVYLAFVALVVSWTVGASRRGDVVGFLVWPFAFLTVMAPVFFCWGDAEREERENKLARAETAYDAATAEGMDEQEALNAGRQAANGTPAPIAGLQLTVIAALVGFFVFAFVPSVARTLWAWVPYVSRSTVEQAVMKKTAMAVVSCIQRSASEDASELASVPRVKRELRDTIQAYDKESLDALCLLVAGFLRYERSYQDDLLEWIGSSCRSGQISEFAMTERTRQLRRELPDEMQQDLGAPYRQEMEMLRKSIADLKDDVPGRMSLWRDLRFAVDKEYTRRWAAYAQTYSEVLNCSMPAFESAPTSLDQEKTSVSRAKVEESAMAVVALLRASKSVDPKDVSPRERLRDMVNEYHIQDYDVDSLNAVCEIVNTFLCFERYFADDLALYIEQAQRTGQAAEFALGSRTKLALEKLPATFRTAVMSDLDEVPKDLGQNASRLPRNFRELSGKEMARVWTIYGQTYKAVLGRAMPSMLSAAE